MDPILKLNDTHPLTWGRSRFVFQHPHDPDLIVKVIKDEVVDERYGKKTKWYKKRRRFGKYISYMREVQEFLAVENAEGKSVHFLQRIVGFAQTDLGLGLVVEAVKLADGTLAPPLATLIRENRFDETAQQALKTFLGQLLESNVIISDLNLGNMVYTHNKLHGHHFVLIDGLGNNSFLPFKAYRKRLNRRSKLGRFERLRLRIERAKRQAIDLHQQENYS